MKKAAADFKIVTFAYNNAKRQTVTSGSGAARARAEGAMVCSGLPLRFDSSRPYYPFIMKCIFRIVTEKSLLNVYLLWQESRPPIKKTKQADAGSVPEVRALYMRVGDEGMILPTDA